MTSSSFVRYAASTTALLKQGFKKQVLLQFSLLILRVLVLISENDNQLVFSLLDKQHIEKLRELQERAESFFVLI